MESVATPVASVEFGAELIRDWVPEGDPRATVVLVHGIAEHSGRYERTGGLLAEARFWVRSYDLIGHGASGGARVDIDDWARFYDQLQVHIEQARHRGRPVVLMGHSMGGLISLGYALESRPQPGFLVLSAPALAGGAAFQRALAGPVAKIAPKLSLPQNVKGSQLSRDPKVGEAYFADPLVHTRGTTRFGKALFDAMDHVKAKCGHLDLPTLVLHGGADSLVPPQSTAFMGALNSCERILYPQLRHEILNEPEGPEVVAEVIKWIDERLTVSSQS